MSITKLTIEAELELLQRDSFSYFANETNRANGLLRDKLEPDWLASIAATGFALAACPVGVEQEFMCHADAMEGTPRSFWNSPQRLESDATGYQGVYYHSLDMRTGWRARQCELSTVHSGFLSTGVLTAGTLS